MDETRAAAKLPHLDVEITHRRLLDDDAEQVTISLRARPSFDEFARFLEAQPAWAWPALSPLFVWQHTMAAFWAGPRAFWPWLPVRRALPGERGESRAPEEGLGGGSHIADTKVHPFPGPTERGS